MYVNCVLFKTLWVSLSEIVVDAKVRLYMESNQKARMEGGGRIECLQMNENAKAEPRLGACVWVIYCLFLSPVPQ